jgi:hypothetical protein
MFKPSELAAVGAAILLLMLSPLLDAARAGVATEESRSAFDAAASAPAPSTPPAPRYRLRCWQEGRLVIEEHGIELPAGSVRLRATDAHRQPLTVIETRNATCLVRAMPAEAGR